MIKPFSKLCGPLQRNLQHFSLGIRMADEPSTNCNDLDLAPIVVEGLRKVSRLDPDEQKGGQTDIDATHTECIHLPKHATLSALWSKLEGEYFEHFGRPHRGEKTRLMTFSFGLCSP